MKFHNADMIRRAGAGRPLCGGRGLKFSPNEAVIKGRVVAPCAGGVG